MSFISIASQTLFLNANPVGDYFAEMNQRSESFEFNPGTSAKTAMWGYGTSVFLDVSSSIALGAKSLLWQGIGRAGAVGSIVALSFTTGLLVGRGLDFLPTYFGEERVSRHLADGLFAAIGPAPDWVQKTAGFFFLD